MQRINKKTIILTLLVTLLPMIVGLLLWKQLPDMIATHFDANNQPNGWSSKAFTVFAIPAILVGMQLICIFVTSQDPKRANISNKAFKLVVWIIPVCSLLVGAVSYMHALQIPVDIGMICSFFVGVILIILGNYLPKNRNNYTFGVRTPWALNDDDNWRISNRVGGYCIVIAGIICIISGFLRLPGLMIAAVILAGLIPVVVSYVYFRKHKNENG